MEVEFKNFDRSNLDHTLEPQIMKLWWRVAPPLVSTGLLYLELCCTSQKSDAEIKCKLFNCLQSNDLQCTKDTALPFLFFYTLKFWIFGQKKKSKLQISYLRTFLGKFLNFEL